MSSSHIVRARAALLAAFCFGTGLCLCVCLNFITGCAVRDEKAQAAQPKVLSDVRDAHRGAFDLTPSFRVRFQLPAPGFCALERMSVDASVTPWSFAAHDDELRLRNTRDGSECVVECVRAQLVDAGDAASLRMTLEFRAQCTSANITIHELLFIEQRDGCAYLIRRFNIAGMAPDFELMVNIPMVDASAVPLEVSVNGSPLEVARDTHETAVLLARDEATEIAVALRNPRANPHAEK